MDTAGCASPARATGGSCNGYGNAEGPGSSGPSALCGGRYRTRTDDLFRVKEARYQLRQSPIPVGYVNRYYRTRGCPDDQSGRHARDSLRVWRSADLRLMFHKCPGQPGTKCGCSAVGSAQPCQGWGREFESRHPLECSRSSRRSAARGVNPHGGVAERLGTGLQSRLHGFESRRHLTGKLNSPNGRDWRSGSALP